MTTIKRQREAVPRVQTNLNLPLAIRHKIERIARKNYLTMTDVIVNAVNAYDQDGDNDGKENEG